MKELRYFCLAMLFVAACATVQAEVSLRAYYSFDDAVNLGDDSVGIWDLTDVYGTPAALNGAYDLDGASAGYTPGLAGVYVDGSFSVSCWVNPDTTGINQMVTRPGSSNAGGFAIWTNGTAPATWGAVLFDGTNYPEVDSGVEIVAGQWDHIVLTFEVTDPNTVLAGVAKIYVNGELAATNSNATYKSGPSYTFCVGARGGGTNFFDGQIDDFAIFEGVLHEGEVEALADGSRTPEELVTNPIPRRPVVYYSFDDAANLRADDSGNSNDLGSYVNDDPNAAAGQVGGAADFNGTTDSLDVVVSSTNPAIYPDGSFTAVCWGKPDVANPGMYLTFPAARKGGFGIVSDGFPATWRVYTYGLNESGASLLGGNVNTGVYLTAGQYDHLAITYEALGSDGGTQGNYTGTLTVYVNGTQVATATDIVYGPNEFRFGLGSRIAVGNYFDGSIDEFAIFDRVLSSGEIGQLYTGPRTPITLGINTTGDLTDDGQVDLQDFAVLAANWLSGVN